MVPSLFSLEVYLDSLIIRPVYARLQTQNRNNYHPFQHRLIAHKQLFTIAFIKTLRAGEITDLWYLPLNHSAIIFVLTIHLPNHIKKC